MAETIEKKYLDLERLGHYDEKIKKVISDGDAAALTAAKSYADGLSDNYDAAGTAETKVNELTNGQVKTNKEAIEKLNGADTVEGSVKAQIKAAKTELEGKITASEYDDTTIKASIKANTDAIGILNGTGDGSVDKKVADAVASIVADAPDSYDTLKEISDWISTHSESASAMNSDIQANKKSIADLAKLVGTLPEGEASKTIVEYIDSKVGAVDFSEAIATAKSEAIDAAAADATTKANTAETNSKKYADSLASNYATASQGAKADTALQKSDIVAGKANGSISVGGEDVAVTGLGSAAYEPKTSFETAGAAKALEDGQVATNKNDIASLKTKVDTLESTNYVAITNEEIDALFADK